MPVPDLIKVLTPHVVRFVPFVPDYAAIGGSTKKAPLLAPPQVGRKEKGLSGHLLGPKRKRLTRHLVMSLCGTEQQGVVHMQGITKVCMRRRRMITDWFY